MALFGTRIRKTDVADFFQKVAMLIDSGYDICSSCELLAKRDGRRKDHSADGIRKVAELLLPDLREGFTLHESMESHPKYFEQYTKQVEVGETSGNLTDVLNRLYDQIRNASRVMSKLKSALTYPVIVLAATFAAAAYLFTSVMPDMINMLLDVGVGETPAMTQLVLDVGTWFSTHAGQLITLILVIVVVLVLYAKTIGRRTAAHFATRIPLIGKVVENNAVAIFMRGWQQMLLAGAEMSVALRTSAESIGNIYIRGQFMEAWRAYAEEGIPVFETLETVDAMREMELQTIQVAVQSGKMAKVLGVLAADREFEAERAINRLTAAVNPILMAIVGIIVGVLVMAIYGPIISVTDAIS